MQLLKVLFRIRSFGRPRYQEEDKARDRRWGRWLFGDSVGGEEEEQSREEGGRVCSPLRGFNFLKFAAIFVGGVFKQ